jgi:hypothetical protein
MAKWAKQLCLIDLMWLGLLWWSSSPLTAFIFTKHSFHLVKLKDTRMTNPRTCKNDQWKGFLGFETIPNMSEVIFFCQIFYILLRGNS